MLRVISLRMRGAFWRFWCLAFVSYCGSKPFVNHHCKFKAEMLLGRNVNFNGARILGGGKVLIGDNFHSGFGLTILTANHNFHGDSIPYDKAVIKKDVTVADNVWVGIDVLILPGVKIGEGVIVQAGSVVSGNVPDLAIVGGNPAKVIKWRDKEHYYRLKSDGKFL